MRQDLESTEISEGSEIASVLLRLAETIAGHTRLDTLLPVVLELTASALCCHGCLLSLWDDNQARFLPVATYGVPLKLERLFYRMPIAPGDFPLVDQIVRSRSPVKANIEDPLVPEILRRFSGHPLDVRDENAAEAILGVPLLHHNNVIGGLLVIGGREDFGPRELALINGAARQTALAVASARAFEAEHRRRRDLETLRETIALLTTELELETLFQRIVERAAVTFEVPAAALFVWDETLESLPPVAIHGLSERYVQQHRAPTDVIRNLLQSHPGLRPFALPDIRLSPLDEPEMAATEGLRAALVIPLRRGDSFLGLIQVYARSEPNPFDNDSLGLAQALSHQVVIALENAWLYHEARERSLQLAEVLAAGREARVNQDISAILQRIAEGIKQGLGWNSVLVTRYDHAAGLAYGVAAAGLLESVLMQLPPAAPLEQRRALYEREQFRISRSYFVPAERGGTVIAREPSAWVAPVADYASAESLTFPHAMLSMDSISSFLVNGVPEPTATGKRNNATLVPGIHLASSERWQPCDFLIVPIQNRHGEVLGTISVDKPHHGRRPELSEVQALEIFADQAAAALENARLFQIEQRRAAELNDLAEVAAAFGALTNLEETYRRVTQAVTRLLSAEKCAIVRFSENMQWAWAEQHGFGASATETGRMRIPITTEIVNLIESIRGEPRIVDDVAALPPSFAQLANELGIQNAVLAFFGRRDQVAGMLIAANKPGGFGQDDAALLLTVAHQAAIAIENAQLFTTLDTEREHLRALSSRLTQAQEAERTRIARELHDEAGQALTTVRLQLDFLASALQPNLPPHIRKQVDEAQALLEHTLEEIRRISGDLRPSLLDDLGLTPALRWQCDRLSIHAGLKVFFDSRENIQRLDPDVETAVYRTTQEALTNIVRHAQATSVKVSLDCRDEHLYLTIADNGVGFPETPDQDVGLGLMGMKERLATVGGTLHINSKPKIGSTLRIKVPL